MRLNKINVSNVNVRLQAGLFPANSNMHLMAEKSDRSTTEIHSNIIQIVHVTFRDHSP